MATQSRLLITGCKGQLGSDLVRLLQRAYDVRGIDIDDVDVTDRKAILSLIGEIAPDVVIHAAAYTDVDGCESDSDLAMSVNRDGTENIARACAEVDANMVYYSTDYVFDGTKAEPYNEDDRPGPRTVYGKSKLAGEMAVQQHLARHVIMRIAWIYGINGKNFVKTMIRLGKAQLEATNRGEKTVPLRVVNDQVGNPTWTCDIVNQTRQLIETDRLGLFHSTSEGEVSWYRFACDIFDNMGMPVALEPCTSAEFPRPACRPARSSLNNRKLTEAGINVMPPYRRSLEEFLNTHGAELI
ncbi:MAG: dTDP-4-dehydrorhamnose reductase [Candidatus Zixiibacteriota bacterium]